MKTVKILAILLMIAVMMSVVGCDNTDQNGGNGSVVSDNYGAENNGSTNVDDDVYQEEDLQSGLADVEYIPSEENLIGVAIYPISVFEKKYAYNVGDLIPIEEAEVWKAIYVTYTVGDDGSGGNVFEGNSSMWKWNGDEQKSYGEYESKTEFLYVGYVYETDGKVCILATHDLVNFRDGVSVINVKTIRTNSDGDNIAFDLTIYKK